MAKTKRAKVVKSSLAEGTLLEVFVTEEGQLAIAVVPGLPRSTWSEVLLRVMDAVGRVAVSDETGVN